MAMEDVQPKEGIQDPLRGLDPAKPTEVRDLPFAQPAARREIADESALKGAVPRRHWAPLGIGTVVFLLVGVWLATSEDEHPDEVHIGDITREAALSSESVEGLPLVSGTAGPRSEVSSAGSEANVARRSSGAVGPELIRGNESPAMPDAPEVLNEIDDRLPPPPPPPTAAPTTTTSTPDTSSSTTTPGTSTTAGNASTTTTAEATTTTERRGPAAVPVSPGTFDDGSPIVVAPSFVTLTAEQTDGLQYKFRVYSRVDGERVTLVNSRWRGSSAVNLNVFPYEGNKIWWTVETRDRDGTTSGESRALYLYIDDFG